MKTVLSNHINYPDANGHIYCRRINRIINLNEPTALDGCFGCSARNGSAQGMGIECVWVDEPGPGVRHVIDSASELTRVSQLIDSKVLKKDLPPRDED